ncbi:MAG: DNA mismatch repair endonuclease MutL [Planctomycetes bacterium]|nr:DNA mismatch repair endonuclease MutL [Planctomycetota bacterium]
MGRIRLLDPVLANKIAAGEVVERPASVVKELVENALDAGASRVDVTLVDGGKTLIRVADDGSGMPPEDLPLAFASHATSKIESAEDLFRIATNGFRGEALASIQSVSRARIVSRTREAATAHEVESLGGEISPVRAAAGACGTVVEVRDLFFNVPARRRWLKGEATEFSHVVETVQLLAAANPAVGFVLRHGERAVLNLPAAQDLPSRIRALFGERFPEGMLELHDHEPYARLEGFIAPPATHRPNSKGLLLFANRRPIRDRSLLQAVLLAYREFVPPGRYPVGVLFLEVDPDSLDVNVHPAKTEVRFLEQNRVFSLLKAAITERLLHAGVLPQLKLAPVPAAPQARPDTDFEPRFDLDERPRLFDETQETAARDAQHRWDRAREALEQAARPLVTSLEVRPPAMDQPHEPASQPAPATCAPLLARARGLFQVGNAYLMVEEADGVTVIDQHAFHERILYWLLEQRVAGAPMERQKLLVPQPLELSPAAAQLADAFAAELREFGFEVEPFGPGTLALRAVPKYSVSSRHQEVVQEVLEGLAQGRRPETPEALRKELVEMVACKAAIKAGDALTPQQIADLLKLAETVPHTFSCPHGRPTTYKLAYRDLEKIFHRR